MIAAAETCSGDTTGPVPPSDAGFVEIYRTFSALERELAAFTAARKAVRASIKSLRRDLTLLEARQGMPEDTRSQASITTK